MFRLTPVVKNLLIVNVAIFAAQIIIKNPDLTTILSLKKIGSDYFAPYQFFTYMFAHSTEGLWHLLGNMISLIIFAPMLEDTWGQKKFLTFYLVVGIGAGIIYNSVQYFRVSGMKNDIEAYMVNPSPNDFNIFVDRYSDKFRPEVFDFIDSYDNNSQDERYINRSKSILQELYNGIVKSGGMLGASGAIFGIIIAFGIIFANLEMRPIFLPFTIKGIYIALFIGTFALYSEFQRNPDDNVAHMAHIAGMIMAFGMIQYWRIKK